MSGFVRPKGAFEEALEELAAGDSDSLVYYYEGLCRLSRHFRRPLEIRRTSPGQPDEVLTFDSDGAATLRYRGTTDRLSRQEVDRYAQDRNEDSVVNRVVYDLLDDSWRKENGQEVDSYIRTRFAR